jgi:hypothetical protein
MIYNENTMIMIAMVSSAAPPSIAPAGRRQSLRGLRGQELNQSIAMKPMTWRQTFVNNTPKVLTTPGDTTNVRA